MTDPSNTAMTSTPEQMMLKPCPFCGSDPELVSGGPGNHFVVCRTCKASSDDRAAENAIAAWNRRFLQRPIAWLDALDFQILANAVPGDSLSCRVSSRGNTGDVALYTSPVSQPEQKPVAVKVLEWEGNQATTPFGTYTVTDDVDDLWHFTFHSYPYGVEDDRGYGREAFAKAAAQADYETRIRSALVDAPPVAAKDDTARSPLASVTEQAVEAHTRVAGFDDVDLDMIRRGDMLGRRLGQKVFAALSSPQSQPHPVAGEAWQPIPYTEAPQADLMIAYQNGSVGALMFHFATEGHDIRDIAREAGFDIKGRDLDGDDDALWAEYEAGGDSDSILPRWNPLPPDGFRLAGKWDTEDGPVAWFIREREPIPAPPVPEQGGQR